jgi:hypothetical protein
VASSGTVTQVVNLYPSATSLPSSSLNPSIYGQSVTLTVKVTSTAPSSPTGTVTFKNGTTSLGSATLNASGVAALTKTNLPAGSLSITATYNGDSETAKSTSASLPQTVNQASSTTTVKSSLNPLLLGQTGDLHGHGEISDNRADRIDNISGRCERARHRDIVWRQGHLQHVHPEYGLSWHNDGIQRDSQYQREHVIAVGTDGKLKGALTGNCCWPVSTARPTRSHLCRIGCAQRVVVVLLTALTPCSDCPCGDCQCLLFSNQYHAG